MAILQLEHYMGLLKKPIGNFARISLSLQKSATTLY